MAADAFTLVATSEVTQWLSTDIHRPDVVMGQPAPMGSGAYGGTGWTIEGTSEGTITAWADA